MKHNGHWSERQQERIEEEYQEPAREVVRVMHHEMRVPLCHVAKALYISESTLRLWCRQWNLETRKRGYIKTTPPGKVQLRARLLGYDNVSSAIGSMRRSGLRWDDIKLKLKCGDGTISRYIKEDDKGFYNLTDGGREIKRINAKLLNGRIERGEIERGGFVKTPLEFVNPIYKNTATLHIKP